MKRKLDLIDRKIILELDTNARSSFSEIGKKLKISKNNVQYRVKKLVEDKVIKKFVSQFSLGTLGLFLGKLYIQLTGLSKETEEELHKYLINDERIVWVARSEGRWDLMIGAYVESIPQFNDIRMNFFKKYEKYISSYDIIFLVEGYTSQRTYLFDKKTPSKKVEKYIGLKKIELDKKDKRFFI